MCCFSTGGSKEGSISRLHFVKQDSIVWFSVKLGCVEAFMVCDSHVRRCRMGRLFRDSSRAGL